MASKAKPDFDDDALLRSLVDGEYVTLPKAPVLT